MSALFERVHAVLAAHRAGVVHRDVKPANLFIEARRGVRGRHGDLRGTASPIPFLPAVDLLWDGSGGKLLGPQSFPYQLSGSAAGLQALSKSRPSRVLTSWASLDTAAGPRAARPDPRSPSASRTICRRAWRWRCLSAPPRRAPCRVVAARAMRPARA